MVIFPVGLEPTLMSCIKGENLNIVFSQDDFPNK